jgi:hypothetical protein
MLVSEPAAIESQLERRAVVPDLSESLKSAIRICGFKSKAVAIIPALLRSL